MLDQLKSGDWITLQRMRAIGWALVGAYALVTALLFATSDGRLDRLGRPLGTDFSQVWVAGKFALEGQPQKPFDPVQHEIRQRAEFSETSGFFHWGYPPYFLLVAALLAMFPYALALALWQGATLPLYLWSVRAIVPDRLATRDVVLIAAAFPAVFVNIGHGHNGFLSAALLAGGVLLVDRRPWLAGALLGAVAYKPQFGLLIPLALAVGGHWRAFAGAALAVAGLTALTLGLFGVETWKAFFTSLDYSRSYVAEQGATGWHKIQSVFAIARSWGAGTQLAYALQGLCALVCAGVVTALWADRADLRLRGAALLVATVLATPYALDYDMMIIGPAIAMIVAYALERGFRPWEKTALALIWISPLVARGLAAAIHIHVGVIAMAALLFIAARRAVLDDALRAPGPLDALWRRLRQDDDGRGQPLDAADFHHDADASRGHVSSGGHVGVFALVGLTGFLIDAGLTLAFVRAGLSPYVARLPAAAIAIAATWWLNRRFTFRSRDPDRLGEAARYYAVSAASAAVNYAVYAGALTVFAAAGMAREASLGVLAASILGSGVAAVATWLLSRAYAFAPALRS